MERMATTLAHPIQVKLANVLVAYLLRHNRTTPIEFFR
jgi:hypothetical protein